MAGWKPGSRRRGFLRPAWLTARWCAPVRCAPIHRPPSTREPAARTTRQVLCVSNSWRLVMRLRQLGTVVATSCLAAVVVGANAQQPAAITVSGPVSLTSALRDTSHGYPFNASTLDLAKQGYVEEEFFIQGAARSYDIPRDQMANASGS